MVLHCIAGELLSGDEEGSDGDDDGEGNVENYINEQMAKLETEKQAILSNKTLIAGVSLCLRCSRINMFLVILG